MGFAALRSLARPIAKTLISRVSTFSPATSPSPKPDISLLFGLFHRRPWIPASNCFHSLTDTRLPKGRPSDKPRQKRASIRPPGPYAWVEYVPGEPILPNEPNEGSVKLRIEKKLRRQRRAFILSEAKKRKAQVQEAKRKRIIQRVERKMADVARDRAWAQRMAELQQIDYALSETRKRKAQVQEAKRKKVIQRIERKMTAVARDRARAQRLAELQQIEEEEINPRLDTKHHQ